jgi:hypothetical protein
MSSFLKTSGPLPKSRSQLRGTAASYGSNYRARAFRLRRGLGVICSAARLINTGFDEFVEQVEARCAVLG